MSENQRPLISVIVPVYNVEPWLRECLDSIINQTLRDIEIICVNDGSTDGSPGILREYAEKDGRIRIIDQENSGLSEARNAGARAAAGKYLYFMDSDDILVLSALELCSERMEQRSLELLCFNAAAFGDDLQSAKQAGKNNSCYFHRVMNEEPVYTGQELFAELKQKKKLFSSVPFCVISRAAFQQYALWFHPHILHEDAPWMFTVLMKLSRCGCLNNILYHRRVRCDSITKEKTTFEHAYGKFAGFLDIQRLILEQPDLLHNHHLADLCMEHMMDRLNESVKAYRACDEEEKQKRFNLPLPEQLLFMQDVAFHASLVDRNVQLENENHSLLVQQDLLNSQALALKKDVKALQNSHSYRLGQKLIFLPGKLKRVLGKNRAARPAGRTVSQAPEPDHTSRGVRSGVESADNILRVLPSVVTGNRISYRYEISGEWSTYFRDNPFEITYPFDMESIPESIRIIPFLSQVLPVCWVCDAEIHVPVCDQDFYACLEDVKAGFRRMYPMIRFGGKLIPERTETNRHPSGGNRPLVCFSGGVDAFSTTLSHLPENPLLVSLWGADVPWQDEEGWKPLETLLQNDAEILGLERLTVRTSFRDLLSARDLNDLVRASGDIWWHGFQHGLGILGHLAPVAWKTNAEKVYITASFVSGDVYTCASDPAMDNHVRFGGTRVVHDGYDLNRQQKIRNIVTWATKKGISVPLHVCWRKKGGDNCCHCEKCWRTMLEIYAEGADPKDFGFRLFDGFKSLSEDLEADYRLFQPRNAAHYGPIQRQLRSRMAKNTAPQELSWLFEADLSELESGAKRLHDGKIQTPCWHLYTPEHTNMGDHFIADTEQLFIRTFVPNSFVVELSGKELCDQKFAQLNRILPSQPVFIHGGGSIGNIWTFAEKNIEFIVNKLKQNKIMIFPQSICFSDDKEGQEALARAKQAYRGDHVLLCCRDQVSFEFAQKNFECPSILVPDSVLWKARKPEYPMDRFGALTLLRGDREKTLSDAEAAKITSFLASRFRSVDEYDTVLGGIRQIPKKERTEQMEAMVNRIASAECVVTDRLHGLIFCAVTGTPCVALPNSYHKIASCYEWIKDLGYLRFIQDSAQLEEAVDAVCACTDRTYPEEKMQALFGPLIHHLQNMMS